MNIRQIAVITLPLIGLTWTLPLAEAREGQPAELVVYTYNYAGVHPDDLEAARQHAETIFKHANLTISWIDCRITGRDAVDILPTCRTDLRPDEVMLRIMSGGAPIVDRITSLGFSLVNRENAHSAWLSSVFADRVVTLAAQAGIHPALLLGRAIAHEVGHLLIGSTGHARLGLMRAFWSHRELMQRDGPEWAFLENEAEAIRSSLTARISRNALARR